MMKKETIEIIRLTTKEILTAFGDAVLVFGGAFSRDYNNRLEIEGYLTKHSIDRADFFRKIYRLKRQGIIRRVTEAKNDYLELTAKGKEKIDRLLVANLIIDKPKEWDKKWRVIMFDIPEREKHLRNLIRSQLYQLGFRQIQKSVFLYPYECSKEINLICDCYGGRKFIKYLIADIIEGEAEIIEYFINAGILTLQDIE